MIARAVFPLLACCVLHAAAQDSIVFPPGPVDPTVNAAPPPAPAPVPAPAPAPPAAPSAGGLPAVTLPGMDALRAGDAGNAQPAFDVIAFAASGAAGTARQIDEAVKDLSGVFRELPYGAFRQVARTTVPTPIGQETAAPLDGRYTLYLAPQGVEENGSTLLRARIAIEDASGAETNALYAEGRAEPGRALLFRGLEYPGGEMGVVVRLASQQNGQGAGGSDSSDPQEPEGEPQDQPQPDPGEQMAQRQREQGEQKDDGIHDLPEPIEGEWDSLHEGEEGGEGDDGGEGEDEQQAMAEAQAGAPEGEGEGQGAAAEPIDNATVESILKSLEEGDRREQKSARNKRDRIEFMGAWW